MGYGYSEMTYTERRSGGSGLVFEDLHEFPPDSSSEVPLVHEELLDLCPEQSVGHGGI